ncbi:MAG: CopG family transcriptional regulator [Chitinivibrionales bacterium]|nr:CopG family transcriptional regulator [Chitinivibrionales bacterium]MBD3357133.1 CopG family transcriptional regulator [Chitinivibrionales bacterium]
MDRRLGFVGIIVEDRKRSAAAVNEVLTLYGHLVVARTGIPNRDDGRSVITLVVEATPDEIGALTGTLGRLQGVSVKSALSKQ